MTAHLLSPVSLQPRATALSDAANSADWAPLSGLCSLLHGPELPNLKSIHHLVSPGEVERGKLFVPGG